MVKFPQLTTSELIKRLDPPTRKVRLVLDTDTYNEIDDQFAVVHALLSPDILSLESIHAAPFFNSRSKSPADGMEKSYQEILRLLTQLQVESNGLVYRGSTAYINNIDNPEKSEATDKLIKEAMISDEDDPLYVVAIGAITNVAAAILLEPAIIEKIVVVWLGGHAHYWPNTSEFNLRQDINASKLIFDCGVPLIQIPCAGVADHLTTTVPEVERYIQGQGEIGNYLAEIFKNYHKDHFGWSKVIWDLSATAYVINPNWISTHLTHSPILTDQFTWSVDTSRHMIRVARSVSRDRVFSDLFTKLKLDRLP
tara:strand:+ start:170 stop:1099 length:930 start_codon:yes stop_codon:yes gene_type:complete